MEWHTVSWRFFFWSFPKEEFDFAVFVFLQQPRVLLFTWKIVSTSYQNLKRHKTNLKYNLWYNFEFKRKVWTYYSTLLIRELVLTKLSGFMTLKQKSLSQTQFFLMKTLTLVLIVSKTFWYTFEQLYWKFTYSSHQFY